MALTRAEQALKRDLYFGNDFAAEPNGDISQIDGLANLKQAILHRIITTPGTLAHRPTYGVGIKDYQNNIGSRANQEQLMHRMIDQFRDEPRIEELTSLAVRQDQNNPGQFDIVLRYRPVGYSEIQETFEIGISL